MKNTPLYRLGLPDFLKGILVAFLTASLAILTQSLESGHLPTTGPEWKQILIPGLLAAAAYLVKNFFSGEKLPKKK